jgi:hypothetical protein
MNDLVHRLWRNDDSLPQLAQHLQAGTTAPTADQCVSLPATAATHKDDDELEGQGEEAIRFELVDSRKQEGGNDADAEDVNYSQHLLPPLLRQGGQSKFPSLALASSCPTELQTSLSLMEAPRRPTLRAVGGGIGVG